MGAFDLQDIPQLFYLGAIFVAVLGYAIAAHRRNLGRLLRHRNKTLLTATTSWNQCA